MDGIVMVNSDIQSRRDFLRNAVILAGAGVTAPLWAAMKYNKDAAMRYFREQASETDARVKEGIETNRKGDATLVFRDAQRRPCERVHVKVRQLNHDFKYGANLFGLAETKNGAESAAAYRELFAAAFNMATLPFYWEGNEPQPGKTRFAKDAPYIYRRPPIDMCLEFCEAHGIEPKAHCLNYVAEGLFPAWAKGDVRREKELLEKRFRELAERYAERIPMWEVVNETLHWSNGRRRLSNLFSEPDLVEWSFKTAAKYFTKNKLVINETHMYVWESFKRSRSAYYMQIENALLKGCRIDGIGIQAHAVWGADMKNIVQKGRFQYNPHFTFELFDAYAALGRPLQITECTIPACSEDPGDEAVQAEIVRELYRIWFSHKAMEAIVYWDLSDAYTWQPKLYGSFLRRDMSPKPAYNVICDLFGREWRTNFDRDAPGGRLSFRGFCGTYEVEATSYGRTVKRQFHIGNAASIPIEISIA